MTTNRLIALLGPYIALLSGAVAAWLSQHFPGLADDVPAETQGITQAITFVAGTLVTWALQHKYLDGWQKWEQAEAARLEHHLAAAATATTPAAAHAAAPTAGEPFGGFDPSIFEDLVAPAPSPATQGAEVALGNGRPSDG